MHFDVVMADVSATETSGPTQAVSKRVKERKHYTEDCLQDEEIEGRRMFSVEEKLASDKFGFHFVDEMKGEDFTYKYLQENGFTKPILFKDKSGLGMRMPSANFTVNDVRQCVGSRRMLDVMDVTTQKDIEMTMKDWCRYFENSNRDKLLNVISLEFSHTRLENYVESPEVVRQVDWVDWVWPRHLKESQTEGTNSIDDMKYPKVQKYCLMSVKGCYTDFHIDFGGTSVWYHILWGSKVFWLIPPTERNLTLYEQWVLSGKQGDVFFGDTVEKCSRVMLNSGDTFLIPTGWIHAVFTPEDTLVFGGNFLHNFGIEKQLRIAEVEDVTRVPVKFRYPFYTEILWYVVQRYVQCLLGKNYLICNEDGEILDAYKQQESDVLNLSTTASDKDGKPAINPVHMNGDHVPYPSPLTYSPALSPKGMQFKGGGDGDLVKTPNGPLPNGDLMTPKSVYNTEHNCNKPKERSHLTQAELDGLKAILKWLQTLPPAKKGIPDLIRDAEGLLNDFKMLILEHQNDDPKLAITGKPALFWTEPKKPRPKPRAGPTPSSSSKGSKSGSKSGNNSNNARRRRTRCKKCEACLRADCGECHFCKDMKKFGGPGRMKQSCISRQCMAPVLPHTACCMICGRDGWDKVTNPPENENSSLMECSQCWEILHPKCLQEKCPDLPVEGSLNDDLPNSWECPKCCRNGKPDQVKPRQIKGKTQKGPDAVRMFVPGMENGSVHESVGTTEMNDGIDTNHIKGEMSQSMVKAEVKDIKRITDDEPLDLGPSKKKIKTEFKTENYQVPKDESDGMNFLNETEGLYPEFQSGLQSNPRKQSTSSASDEREELQEESSGGSVSSPNKNSSPDIIKKQFASPSHVRSCARHPITVKKIVKNDSGKVLAVKNENEKPCTAELRTKARVISGVAPRKHGETARERLFRSLKGLKKNSELLRHGGILKVKSHGVVKNDEPVAIKSLTKSLLKMDKNGGETPIKKIKNGVSHCLIDESSGSILAPKEKSGKCDSDDDKSPPSQNHKISSMLRNSPNLKKPKYVVRPAPVIEDFPEEKRKNSRTGLESLALEKEVMLPVFKYLSVSDLYVCQFVCKTWNRWSVDPRLWTVMDLTRRKITASILIGIVRRQPVTLNLSWTNLSRRQLAWIIARLPQMKELILSGCSSAAVAALCTCNCPLLRSLDLSWVEGLTDSVIRDLLAPPPDSRPGFIETKTRLRHLTEVKLAGADISDVSVRLLAHHLPLLAKLDLSHCHKVTDMGIAVLGAAKSTRLSSLDVSSCSNITDTSLEALKRCTNLYHLDMRDCSQVTEAACVKFVAQNRQTLTLKDGKFILRRE